MEALRHIVTPDTNTLKIMLPDNLVNEKLEVIILTIGEVEEGNILQSLKSQRGKVSKEEAERMLSFVEESRKEWQ
jgi:hypothetical protein